MLLDAKQGELMFGQHHSVSIPGAVVCCSDTQYIGWRVRVCLGVWVVWKDVGCVLVCGGDVCVCVWLCGGMWVCCGVWRGCLVMCVEGVCGCVLGCSSASHCNY